jgi:hypothetical protein
MVGQVSSAASISNTAQTQEARSRIAERIFKAADSNQDGKITEDELSSAMAAQGGKQGPSAADLFKQLDQGNKGYITRQDVEDGLAKAGQSKAAANGKTSRNEGGGGPHGGGGASAAKVYDPADLNQDGVVTMRERMTYAQQAYTAKESQTSGQAAVYG